MVAFISEERGNPGGGTQSIIVSEFCKRQQCIPIVLLVIAKYLEVLFQGLISPFCLTVAFGMVSRGEMELHIKCFSKRMEKLGDELGATVGGHMFGNTVFREDMHDEYYCKVFGGAMDSRQDEYALLG